MHQDRPATQISHLITKQENNMKRLCITMLFISQPVFAAEYEWSNECDQNQLTMTNCSIDRFEFYDHKLNKAYKNAMRTLSPEKQQNLRTEQRNWLTSRDPSCKAEADDVAVGGSMWPMIYNGCRANSTTKRTQEIKLWMQ